MKYPTNYPVELPRSDELTRGASTWRGEWRRRPWRFRGCLGVQPSDCAITVGESHGHCEAAISHAAYRGSSEKVCPGRPQVTIAAEEGSALLENVIQCMHRTSSVYLNNNEMCHSR